MKRLSFLAILMLIIVSAAIAGNSPRIVRCGLDPVTIQPGQDFTLFADVSDPDGLSDVNLVGLLAENELLMTVPKSDSQAGRFEVSYTMPDTAPSGTYTLSMAAADSQNNVSSVTYFTFKIATESSVVELTSPANGEIIDCQGITVFEWIPYTGPVDTYVFALNLVEGVQVTATVPSHVTSLPIPGELWKLMPDGEYFWQVGVVSEPGAEPAAWSELRAFTTQCNNPWPSEVFGVVTEKDDANQALRVRSNWRENPHGVWVSVTENTIIWNAEGLNISYADIMVDDNIFALGQFTNEMFVADEIFVEGSTPPTPTEEVSGTVTAIDLTSSTLSIFCRHSQVETIVQITSDTMMFNEYGPITLEDVQVNDFADAFGSLQGDIFVADEMFVMSHQGPGPGDHYFGTIASIDSERQTFDLEFDDHGMMEVITIQVNDGTILQNFAGDITFGDLEVGQIADTNGIWEEDVFVAHLVMIHDGHQPPPQDHVFGTIVDVNAQNQQISVTPDMPGNRVVIIQITADTLIEGPMGPLTFDDLAVDQWVMADGVFEGDLFTAFFIMVDDGQQPPPPQDHVFGTIVDVNALDQQISVTPDMPGSRVVIIQITAETLIEGPMGPLTFDDLAVDQWVMADGVFEGDLFTALYVMVDDGQQPPPPQEHVYGAITEINTTTMQITINPDNWDHGMVIVQITADTVIEDWMGSLTFDDLAIDQMVMVEGEYTGDLFTAFFVMVHDNQQPPQPGHDMTGIIGAIDYNLMTFELSVDGHHRVIPVQATTDTVITGPQGPMMFTDLQNGDFVIVMLEPSGGVFLAQEILLPE